MIAKVLTIILLMGAGLAIFQATGGTQEDFFATTWNVFYTVVTFVANLLTTAWNTVFA